MDERSLQPFVAGAPAPRSLHPPQVSLRRQAGFSGGDCCAPAQRLVSVIVSLGFAIVRASPTPDFRSRDEVTLADGDESAMNLRQKVNSPECLELDSLLKYAPVREPESSPITQMGPATTQRIRWAQGCHLCRPPRAPSPSRYQPLYVLSGSD